MSMETLVRAKMKDDLSQKIKSTESGAAEKGGKFVSFTICKLWSVVSGNMLLATTEEVDRLVRTIFRSYRLPQIGKLF